MYFVSFCLLLLLLLLNVQIFSKPCMLSVSEVARTGTLLAFNDLIFKRQ